MQSGAVADVGADEVKVLAADDEPFALHLLVTLLTRAGYEVVTARDGAEAERIVFGDDPPAILLLDWMMPLLDGVELCRRIRQAGGWYRYIMLVSARSRRQDVLEGLAAGADDFVSKPYSPEELLARVRVAERMLTMLPQPAHRLIDALAEATRHPGGDVVVRDGDIVGRVFFHQGRVAWAHLSTQPHSLQDRLVAERVVSTSQLAAIVAECRQSGQNFGEALLARGLLDHAALRAHMRAFLSEKIAGMMELTDPAVVFLPQSRTFNSDLALPLEELLPEPTRVTAAVTPLATAEVTATPGNVAAILEQVAGLPSVVAVAVFEPLTARCLGRVGEPFDQDLVRAQAVALSLLRDEQAEDVIVTSASHYHLLRLSTGAALLYVKALRAETTLVLLRHRVASVACRLLLDPAPTG